jgi:hypothetical protein
VLHRTTSVSLSTRRVALTARKRQQPRYQKTTRNAAAHTRLPRSSANIPGTDWVISPSSIPTPHARVQEPVAWLPASRGASSPRGGNHGPILSPQRRNARASSPFHVRRLTSMSPPPWPSLLSCPYCCRLCHAHVVVRSSAHCLLGYTATQLTAPGTAAPSLASLHYYEA